jgi:hypothetical protein
LRIVQKRESEQSCAGEEAEKLIFHDEKV